MSTNLVEENNDIKPLSKIVYASLSGRSKRKFERRNTVHLKAICPKCGAYGMKYKKDIFYNGGNDTDHNKWYCSKCGKRASREELKYVKYE